MTIELTSWVSGQLGLEQVVLTALPQDASFKRFYRVQHHHKSYIVMTAPPDKEKVVAFYDIAIYLSEIGLTVPEVIAADLGLGYFIMTDLGEARYHESLTLENMDFLYRQALSALLTLQKKGDSLDLPKFGENFIRQECLLFTDWCLSKALGLSLSQIEQELLESVFVHLIHNASVQPQVLVHRDYHSQNLFVMQDLKKSPGIIDFQDAVLGPITYDLVSLLKDCRLALPPERIRSWVEDFYLALVANKQLPPNQLDVFFQWFDWMGMQLHIKVLGIFSRLCFRDNKPQYLYHMPRILQYLLNTTAQYDVFLPFHEWMQTRLKPAFQEFWQAQHISVDVDKIRVA